MTRKSSFVLGLMSGTSADAIDVALARISGAPPRLDAKLLNHTSIRFPPQLRKEILRVAEQQPISAGQFSQLNFRLGETFAEAALTACRRFRISTKKIALIGSHGQTIFHQGRPVSYLGRPTRSTLQIGEPAVIAARTGITTIADFRPADIAEGGQGAPLVPYADYLLYRHEKLGRVSLNLGGIAPIFTALSIVDALNRCVLPKAKIHQLIVSGGGSHNPLIMGQISAALPGVQILPSSHLGVPEDAKEAFAFALLAYETFHRRPSNLPSATGARGPAILGRVSYAPPR